MYYPATATATYLADRQCGLMRLKANCQNDFFVRDNQSVSMTVIAHRHIPAPIQLVTHVVHPMSYCLITCIASLLMITLPLCRRRSSWHTQCAPLFHHANARYSLFPQDGDGLLNKAINMTACRASYWPIVHYTAVTINGNELHLMNMLCNQVSYTKHLLKGTGGVKINVYDFI